VITTASGSSSIIFYLKSSLMMNFMSRTVMGTLRMMVVLMGAVQASRRNGEALLCGGAAALESASPSPVQPLGAVQPRAAVPVPAGTRGKVAQLKAAVAAALTWVAVGTHEP
jgi:hypothetical protein